MPIAQTAGFDPNLNRKTHKGASPPWEPQISQGGERFIFRNTQAADPVNCEISNFTGSLNADDSDAGTEPTLDIPDAADEILSYLTRKLRSVRMGSLLTVRSQYIR